MPLCNQLQEYLRPQSKNLDLPPAGQWKTNLQVGYPKPDLNEAAGGGGRLRVF